MGTGSEKAGAGGRNANGHKTTAETKEGHTKRETWKQGARPNTDMTGETHTEDMADSHRRHRKETEPKKTDTNKLNSIKKLNSRLN